MLVLRDRSAYVFVYMCVFLRACACVFVYVCVISPKVQKRAPVGTESLGTRNLFWRLVIGVMFARGGFSKFHQLRLCTSFKNSTSQKHPFLPVPVW